MPKKTPKTSITSKHFDFSTHKILEWEVENIRNLAKSEDLEFTQHASEELLKDRLTVDDALYVVLNKHTATKDLPDNRLKRVPGITFKGYTEGGKLICIKVAAREDYIVVTVYERVYKFKPRRKR